MYSAFCNVAGIKTCAGAVLSYSLPMFAFAGGVTTRVVGALPFGCKALAPSGEAFILTNLPETCARDGAGRNNEAYHLAAEALPLISKGVFPSADGIDHNAEANCCAGEESGG